MKTPREVANLVINAIRNNDLDLMISLFNNANRRKFLPITEDKIKMLSRLRKNELRKIADIKEVEEFRKPPFFIKYDSIITKVSQSGNDVHLIVLTKEDDGYFFEDFLTLNINEFQKLEKLDL